MPHWLCSEYPNASTLYGIFPALVLVELTVWRFHKLGRKITNRNNIDFHLTNSSTTNTALWPLYNYHYPIRRPSVPARAPPPPPMPLRAGVISAPSLPLSLFLTGDLTRSLSTTTTTHGRCCTAVVPLPSHTMDFIP
jgi:hypothetical protein